MFRIGLARLAGFPLAVQLLCSGCQWVPIEPDFARGTTRYLDQVRIDGQTDFENVSINGFIVTADKRERVDTKVTIDATKTPVSVNVPNTETLGKQPWHLDQLRVGDDVLSNATIAWPIITGYKQTLLTIPVTADLRTRLVQRLALSPGGKAAIVVPSVVAGLGLVALITIYALFASAHLHG